ncbi:MAG: branched-chain amino acid ABC transporter substrate-binding protein [Desulfobulbus sp.]|nr:branched-chain amino acid ABC transporter substrate-binding protein [Desulfobulbus sp.]
MKRLLCLVAGLFCAMVTSTQAADAVKIGLMGPLTGAWAGEGQEMKQVVGLLAEELNQQGGVNGKKVEILNEDDAGDPRQASLAANRLATQGVVAVIGTYGSAITEATQNIYDEAGVIQVANGSTAIRLSEKGLASFFRTCPRDDEQGKVATATIRKLGFKKVAIIHDSTSYAKGLAEETRTNLKNENIPVVFFDALTPGERDYNTILTKMKAADPDFVFFTGYYPEAGLLLRQKKEMGWAVPFMGGDAVNNPELVKIAGTAAAEGFLFLTPPLPKDLDTPEARAFVAAFEKKFGNAPRSIYPVLAGDGFRVIIEAIKGTGSTDPVKVSTYLKKSLKDFPGLTGKISFNDKGDRVGEVYRVYKVDNQGSFILQP